MAHPLLNVTDLSINCGLRPILKHISFKVPAQGITAIIGPSGSGKSTLLKCLNGLLRFQHNFSAAGKVEFQGQEILQNKKSLAPDISLVFQKPNPFPVSVRKNLQLVLETRGIKGRASETAVQQLLTQVDLWTELKDRLDEKADALSGGQQQRLCLARVLALQPRLICLDEPCSHLDPISTTKIETSLNGLKTSTAILMVTHNLQQAKRLADHVLVLWPQDQGSEILEFGETLNIFTSPRHETTRRYVEGAIG